MVVECASPEDIEASRRRLRALPPSKTAQADSAVGALKIEFVLDTLKNLFLQASPEMRNDNLERAPIGFVVMAANSSLITGQVNPLESGGWGPMLHRCNFQKGLLVAPVDIYLMGAGSKSKIFTIVDLMQPTITQPGQIEPKPN